MTVARRVLAYWPAAALVAFAALPFVPGPDAAIYGQRFMPLFIYAVLALGLNVVLGYTGLFHLGIAAFFGIGAYATAILTVPQFPFQQSFLVGVIAAALAAAAVGVVTTAPTLRLRGDYLALVTMGFGLIAVFVIRNLENITAGTKGLNPVSPRLFPGMTDPDLAAAPGLRARPLDAVVEVLRLARRPHFEIAGRASGAARVDTHDRVAVGHPFFRIDQLPVLVLVARSFGAFGKGFRHAQPCALVPFLERQPLGVGPVAQDHRIAALGNRAEHVRAQDDAVVHRDRGVPFDDHAVARLGFRLGHDATTAGQSSWLPRAIRARTRGAPCGSWT